MTNAEAYNNAPLGASIDAWTSFRNNIIMGYKPSFKEWLEYECDRMPTLRNCDMYSDETKAKAAWLEYCETEDLPRSSKTEGAFVPWLFAPAKEGGAE